MDIFDVLDRPIAFHRCFVTITGSVTAAVMLSQAVYWSTRTQDPDGWFWKTQADWEEETGLTRREQETARKTLRNLGLIEENLAGVPATLHFKVNKVALKASMANCAKPSMAESAKLVCTKAPNLNGGKRQSLLCISENTTETTTETTDMVREDFSKDNAKLIAEASKYSELLDQEWSWTEFCRRYPKRSGSLNKSQAKEKFLALHKLGLGKQMLDGARRYSDWATATGKAGTELVAQMTTWLNGRRWEEDWDIPPPSNGKPPIETMQQKYLRLGGGR